MAVVGAFGYSGQPLSFPYSLDLCLMLLSPLLMLLLMGSIYKILMDPGQASSWLSRIGQSSTTKETVRMN